MLPATSVRSSADREPTVNRLVPVIEPRRATQEGIRALLEIEAVFRHPQRPPVMLIQADAGREWQIRAHADEHASPALIVDVKVVLHDAALCDLQMPPVLLPVSYRSHDASRLAALHDCHDLVWL